MENSTFKKLALMGIAGGLLMTAEAPASFGNIEIQNAGTLLAGSCGSGKGTGHQCGSNPQAAQYNRAQQNRNTQTADNSDNTPQQNNTQGQGSNQRYNRGSCNSSRNAPTADNSARGSCGSSRNTQTADNSSRGSCGAKNRSPIAMNEDVSKAVSEQDLMPQLNDDAKATYQGLDAEGKALARQYAAQTCAGKNGCNQGGGQFKDKNEAVKAAAQQMADKRAQMSK